MCLFGRHRRESHQWQATNLRKCYWPVTGLRIIGVGIVQLRTEQHSNIIFEPNNSPLFVAIRIRTNGMGERKSANTDSNEKKPSSIDECTWSFDFNFQTEKRPAKMHKYNCSNWNWMRQSPPFHSDGHTHTSVYCLIGSSKLWNVLSVNAIAFFSPIFCCTFFHFFLSRMNNKKLSHAQPHAHNATHVCVKNTTIRSPFPVVHFMYYSGTNTTWMWMVKRAFAHAFTAIHLFYTCFHFNFISIRHSSFVCLLFVFVFFFLALFHYSDSTFRNPNEHEQMTDFGIRNNKNQ